MDLHVCHIGLQVHGFHPRGFPVGSDVLSLSDQAEATYVAVWPVCTLLNRDKQKYF